MGVQKGKIKKQYKEGGRSGDELRVGRREKVGDREKEPCRFMVVLVELDGTVASGVGE